MSSAGPDRDAELARRLHEQELRRVSGNQAVVGVGGGAPEGGGRASGLGTTPAASASTETSDVLAHRGFYNGMTILFTCLRL